MDASWVGLRLHIQCVLRACVCVVPPILHILMRELPPPVHARESTAAKLALASSSSTPSMPSPAYTRQVAAVAGKPLCSSSVPVDSTSSVTVDSSSCSLTSKFCYQLGATTSVTCGSFYRQTGDGKYRLCKWSDGHCRSKGEKTEGLPSCAAT